MAQDGGGAAEHPLPQDWVEAAPRPRPLTVADLPGGAFRTERTVRFSDCDPAGIVYTPRFVDMMSGVIEDFFPAALGLDYHGLLRDERIGLGYARIGVDFLRPGLMGDRLEFAVVVGRIGGASAAFTLHAFRDGGEILRGTLVMVTTSLAQHRAIPLPAPLRAALVAYQDRCR